jgi:hypothetical protein
MELSSTAAENLEHYCILRTVHHRENNKAGIKAMGLRKLYL